MSVSSYWWLVFMILIASGCKDAFEYSPNQVFDDDSKRDLNKKNLLRLDTLPKDDTIVFALTGDSQRFYDELESFIDTVNQIPSVDFILLAGDISDFGLLEEFELIQEKFSRLSKPYIGIVGNHDLVARGKEVYERMYGPLNFSFVYDSIKFVIHDTNGVAYTTKTVPDLTWLQNEFATEKSVKHHIGVSHIPPFSEDFNKDVENTYTSLLEETPTFLISLHGHVHELSDGFPYNDRTRYITAASFDKRNFVLMKIYNGVIEKQVIEY